MGRSDDEEDPVFISTVRSRPSFPPITLAIRPKCHFLGRSWSTRSTRSSNCAFRLGLCHFGTYSFNHLQPIPESVSIRVGTVGPALSSGAPLLVLLPTLNSVCDSPFLPYTGSFSINDCAVINLDRSLPPDLSRYEIAVFLHFLWRWPGKRS